jgi:hypothetical protein
LGKELAQIIPSLIGRWNWSAVAVLSVELVAAGAMIAVGSPELAISGSSEELARNGGALEAPKRRAGQLIELDLSSAATYLHTSSTTEVREVGYRNGCGWVG